jgi:prepilin-type N-terminal cleavage/methylation domain-containing protein
MEQSLARRSRLSRSADLLSSARTGFSLVELSIVLVILGLLTGGILTGQNLIRAAELRSVVSDFQRYQTALHTFQSKYFALPGDITNATAFWGAADGGDGAGSDCFTAVVTDQTTCNGNGDGFINSPAGGVVPWILGERFMAWKHMANAGLIEGTYTGRTNSTTYENAKAGGINLPASRVSPAYFILAMLGSSSNTYFNPYSSNKNTIIFNSSSDRPLTPGEAWSVDKKLDDGRPGTGRMTTIDHDHANGADCTDNGDPQLAEFQLDNDIPACPLVWFY